MIRGMASAGGRCLNGIDESIEVVDETGNFFLIFIYSSYETLCVVTHVF